MRKDIYINKDITFGCEIEFISRNRLQGILKEAKIKGCKFKYEPHTPLSCIYESISPILTNNKSDLESLKLSLDIITSTGGFASDKCGGHIHYGANIVNDDNFMNMLKLWCISEKLIYDFSKGEFENIRKYANSFARPIKSELSALIKLYEMHLRNLNAFKHFYKSYSINISNHIYKREKKDTFEVRVPNGTINYEVWLNNIDFFGNLLSFADKEESKDLINFYFKHDLNIEKDLLRDSIFMNDESKFYFEKQLNKEYVIKR